MIACAHLCIDSNGVSLKYNYPLFTDHLFFVNGSLSILSINANDADVAIGHTMVNIDITDSPFASKLRLLSPFYRCNHIQFDVYIPSHRHTFEIIRLRTILIFFFRKIKMIAVCLNGFRIFFFLILCLLQN